MVNANKFRKFSGLDGMGFLEVSKVFPGSRTIHPLAANLPASGGMLHLSLTIPLNNTLVMESDSYLVTSAVNQIIQQDILVAIGVKSSIVL